jgi:hypothetical protein
LASMRRTNCPVSGPRLPRHHQAMVKRGIGTVLWFIAAWTASSMLAYAFSLPLWIVAVVASTAAVLVAVDPRRVIWSGNPRTS